MFVLIAFSDIQPVFSSPMTPSKPEIADTGPGTTITALFLFISSSDHDLKLTEMTILVILIWIGP